jgi:hypothetical protein
VNEQGKTVCADCRKQYQTRQTFLRWEFDSFSCLTPDCRHLCRAAPQSAGEPCPAVQALSPARSTVESPDQTMEDTRHLTLENGQNNAPHTTDARPDDEPEDEFEMSFIGDGDLDDHQFLDDLDRAEFVVVQVITLSPSSPICHFNFALLLI